MSQNDHFACMQVRVETAEKYWDTIQYHRQATKTTRKPYIISREPYFGSKRPFLEA